MWFSHKLVWFLQTNSKIIPFLLPSSAESITDSSLHATLVIKVNIGILFYSLEKCFYVHEIDQQGIVEKDTGFAIQRSLPPVQQSEWG